MKRRMFFSASRRRFPRSVLAAAGATRVALSLLLAVAGIPCPGVHAAENFRFPDGSQSSRPFMDQSQIVSKFTTELYAHQSSLRIVKGVGYAVYQCNETTPMENKDGQIARIAIFNILNPDELIGAAHAGCFSMAFSMILGGAGFTPDRIGTTATITLEQKDGGFAITTSHLDVTASIPGIDDAKFQELAAKAKAGCPVSKLLNATITMNAKLA